MVCFRLQKLVNDLGLDLVCFRLQKLVKDLNKYIQTDDSGPWPQNKVTALDRAVGEIGRIMDKRVSRASQQTH